MQTQAISLSPSQARKIVLLSQGIYKEKTLGHGANAALLAIEKLGFIQIDTISVVERAHHHTLWNRTVDYQNCYLDELLEQRTIYEYWSHAAAYLPMRDFKYSLPRKLGVKRRDHGYWDFNDKKMIAHVLDRIRAEGPLQARDFEATLAVKRPVKKKGWPAKKPAKKALDQLFMEGDLMIVRRDGFQKVYDLTERVLPNTIDTSFPEDDDYYKHLIVSYLNANGIGNAAQISYLLKGLKPSIQKVCDQLLEDKKLIPVQVNGQSYYAEPSIEQKLSIANSRNRIKILSPFDNLLIQRQRTRALFNFDYQIECYVPAARRKYGYFCLPLLQGDRFIGRMDAKIDRKSGVLHIQSLHLEKSTKDKFRQALKKPLNDFLIFNNGRTINYC